MSEYLELKNIIKDIKVLLGKYGSDVAKYEFLFFKKFFSSVSDAKNGIEGA